MTTNNPPTLFLVSPNTPPINMRTNNPPTPYLINLFELNLDFDTHKLYNITFDSNHTVQTLFTSSPMHVECWFIDTRVLTIDAQFPVTGLHIEWGPNKPATIHLCRNNICLVYQIIHSPYISPSLALYLESGVRFVGVGIKAGVEKLLSDYNLRVANYVDLRSVAAEKLNDRELLRSTGIKMLAERFLGKVVEKPLSVVMSRWDSTPWLSDDQVKHATLDAYAAFEIGRRLYTNLV